MTQTGEEPKSSNMSEKKDKSIYYQLVRDFVRTMNFGDVEEIDKPNKQELKMLRHYLTIESQKAGKRFSTKTKGDKLLIARVRKENPFGD